MANIQIFKTNVLATPGVVLKNGTGGAAPALDEDPDWPMRNLLLQDRYSAWRSKTNNAIVSVDFDLGSAQTIIDFFVTNYRFYGVTAFSGGVDLYSGSSYPPGDFIDSFSILANDNRFVMPSTSARYWRMDVATPVPAGGAVSCKLWLGRAADRLIITHDWSYETRLANRRLREELRTPSGLLYAFEPAISIASNVREADLVLKTATLTEWNSLRDALSGADSRFLITDPTGALFETSLPGGRIAATRNFYGAYEIALRLEAHP